MSPLLWRVIYHAVQTLAGCDDALWVDVRRGILMVVKGETAQASRQGLRMIAAAIERRYGLTERAARD